MKIHDTQPTFPNIEESLWFCPEKDMNTSEEISFQFAHRTSTSDEENRIRFFWHDFR